jgi:hypothetical protein
MGFFNKIFGRGEKTEQLDETQPQQNSGPCKTEQELIERFGGNSFDKQIDLGEIIGENDWNVDMTKGEISFGSNLVFPIQVLGTFSHSSETWLWAWANTKSGLSENMTQQAHQLKKYGEENEIGLLSNSEFDATIDDLHLIGLIASGIFNSSGYYIADYGQGAMVVTIRSEKVDKIHKDNHHRILTVFPQLISQFEMNHNLALTNYLIAKGYKTLENGTKLTATKNENTITAEFDDQSRLLKLNG